MLLAKYVDQTGKERCNLYDSFEQYHRDTFSPECVEVFALEFRIPGKTYQERKENARALAVDYSGLDCSGSPGISWGELGAIQAYFETAGARYGLLEEFRENAII